MIRIKTIKITCDNEFEFEGEAKYSCDITAKYLKEGVKKYGGEMKTDDLPFDNAMLTEIADKILAEYRRLINET